MRGVDLKGTGFNLKGTGSSLMGRGFRLKGAGFSPYGKALKRDGALAPEAMQSQTDPAPRGSPPVRFQRSRTIVGLTPARLLAYS